MLVLFYRIQTVQDDEDEERARTKIIKSYKDFMGHEPKNVSIPKKNQDGFYECSKSGKVGVLTDVEKEIQLAKNFVFKNLFTNYRIFSR